MQARFAAAERLIPYPPCSLGILPRESLEPSCVAFPVDLPSGKPTEDASVDLVENPDDRKIHDRVQSVSGARGGFITAILMILQRLNSYLCQVRPLGLAALLVQTITL